MPEGWSWFFGHILVLQKYVDQLPHNTSVVFALREMSQEFTDTEVYMVDFWPVSQPLLTMLGPETISNV